MDRSDVITLPQDTPWLEDAAAQAVCQAVTAEKAAIYFVGGCVRDALLGQPGSDTDLATDATPQEVMRLAEAAGLKAVPTGIDHGTVTVVAKGVGYEVTTFRRDVETDGRRAVVTYSRDIAEDARRRDFTMNALYATPSGEVVDPLGGLADCLARRVRFIEDASTRIREDYLRILRYFRFHAWYAPAEAGFDADALDAIASNTQGLETLSAERIGAEMLRLLAAPDPARAVATMRQTGCLSLLLPGGDDRYLGPVVHLEEACGRSPSPLLRLVALGGGDVAERWRLSREQRRTHDRIREAAFSAQPPQELGYRVGYDIGASAVILRAALAERPLREDELAIVAQGAAEEFPVRAKDLMPEYTGPDLGVRLAQLETRWIASGFTLSREELLAEE